MKKPKLFLCVLFVFCGLITPRFFIYAAGAQQPILIKGEVVDADEVPLPGVNVVIQGATRGTVTDLDGKFSISVPNENSTLVISFVGYQTQTIAIANKRVLNITLLEASTELDEVVVVGYGVQRKVSVTGAVSSLDTKELKMSSSPNLTNALAGRISGLTSTQSLGGQPGRDDATMYLRGAATTNGKSPLILIDGVPRDNIRTIDPNEVESISILKDASATSVFGVRGANGVILITTRRGKEGKPELTINATQTFSALTREPERVHSLDYIKYRNEAYKNDGLESSMFSQEIIDKFENPLHGLDPNDPDFENKAAIRRYMYPDNDYYRMMINRWSPQTVINANLTGGTEKISYFMNVGYTHQGGNLNTEPKSVLGYDPSVKLDRYSFRSNLDYKLTPSLTAFLNLGTYIEKVNMPATGIMYGNDQNHMMRDMFYQAQSVVPLSPGPTTIAGFGIEPGLPLDPSYLNSGHYMDRSPYEILNNRGYLQETRANLNSTIGMNWNLGFLTEGLMLKGMFSYDSYAKTIIAGITTSRLYMAMIDPKTDELTFSEVRSTADPLSLSKGVTSKYTINAQASLLYNRNFGLHEVGGMILAQRDYWESEKNELPYNVLGVAGRATYNYDLRYFGEFNMGYNGSEQFAPSKRYGFFPAASVGWTISNEGFMEDNPIVTYLKLRASMGRVGNDKIAGDLRFLYQDNITMGGGYSGSIAQGAGVDEGLLGNPNITWETAQKYNIGLDFQIVHDLKGSVDVFQENRKNILLERKSVPAFQGVPLGNIPRVNLGEVENKGFEVELTYTKQVLTDLLIEVKGNFGYNRNKRIDVDEVPRDGSFAYPKRETGFPIGQEFGYQIDWDRDEGYWTPESIKDPDRVPYEFGTPRVGDFVYMNVNETDNVINEKDQVPIGVGNIPRITWGASVGGQYRGFDVYVFFQGLGQYYSNRSDQGVYETTLRGTYFPYHKTAWTEERWENGDKITYPALTTVAGNVNQRANSFFVMNRSFARLKNAELGYTLPKNMLNSIGISKVRVFISGQNIFTWSPDYRLTHLDPENDDTIGYPVTKMFNFGANITF